MSERPNNEELSKWISSFIENDSALRKNRLISAKARLATAKRNYEECCTSEIVANQVNAPVYEGRVRKASNEVSRYEEELDEMTPDIILKQIDVIMANKNIAGYKVIALRDRNEPALTFFTHNLCFEKILSDSAYDTRGDGMMNVFDRDATLGRYLIILSKENGYIPRMHNLNKSYAEYDHWGIEGGRCCWGGWIDQINDSVKTVNISGLIETSLMFIKSAGADGAYLSATQYQDEAVEFDSEIKYGDDGYPTSSSITSIIDENNNH